MVLPICQVLTRMVWFNTVTGKASFSPIWVVAWPIIFWVWMIFLLVNINPIFNRSVFWCSGSLERHWIQCEIKTERIMFILVSFFGFRFFGWRFQGFSRIFEMVFDGADDTGRWVERRKRPLRSNGWSTSRVQCWNTCRGIIPFYSHHFIMCRFYVRVKNRQWWNFVVHKFWIKGSSSSQCDA